MNLGSTASQIHDAIYYSHSTFYIHRGKIANPMYDWKIAVPHVFSSMRNGRIHSHGLRFSRIAEVSVIMLLVMVPAFAQVSPIHAVAAAKPQPRHQPPRHGLRRTTSHTVTHWPKALLRRPVVVMSWEPRVPQLR